MAPRSGRVANMTESEIDYSTAAGLANALRQLFEAGHKVIGESAKANALQQRIIDHLGCGLTEIVFVGEDFARWEHVNVQRGVDVYLAEHTPDSTWFGVNSM